MVFAVAKPVLQSRVRPSIPATSVRNDGPGWSTLQSGGIVLFAISMSRKDPEWRAREGNSSAKLMHKALPHNPHKVSQHEKPVRL
jgi:hypothetical protein